MVDATPEPVETDTDTDAKARLREEFPGWNIIRSDVGRWWATRGPLASEDLNRTSDVDADTPEELAAEIRAVNRAR